MEPIARYVRALDWAALVTAGLRIILILLVAWIVLGVFRALLRRFERRQVRRSEAQGISSAEASKRADTLTKLLRQALVLVVWLIAGLMALRELGVDIAPVLAGAGIVGLAVGFGAQNLVRDVISGFFVILENQARVGDVAIINGTGGVVEQVNFRTLVLRDLAGVVHVFPNGTIGSLSNMTLDWSAFVFELGVAYKEDTDRVVEVLECLGREMREDDHFGASITEDIEIFGVDAFADSSVVIKGRLKTHPGDQWEVGREFRRRVKKAFDSAGIEIPFPHRSLYFGEASKPFVAQLLQGRQDVPRST